jgi:hypothetical protein
MRFLVLLAAAISLAVAAWLTQGLDSHARACEGTEAPKAAHASGDQLAGGPGGLSWKWTVEHGSWTVSCSEQPRK